MRSYITDYITGFKPRKKRLGYTPLILSITPSILLRVISLDFVCSSVFRSVVCFHYYIFFFAFLRDLNIVLHSNTGSDPVMYLVR